MTGCRHRDPEVLEVRTQSGYDIKLEPEPVDALGELREALAGRACYSLRVIRGEVYWRHPTVVRSRPAGTRAPLELVHRQHVCTPAPSSDPGPVVDPTPARTPLGGTVGG